MSEARDGGPAFPRSIGHGTLLVAGEARTLEIAPQSGMTLRDWFAGQAVVGYLADPDVDSTPRVVASYCYDVADAMLAEREKAR